MTLKIRKAKLEDVHRIHEMHMQSIRDNWKHHYTIREIEAASGRVCNEDMRRKSIQNDHVLVLTDDDRILGYSHFTFEGELLALYLDVSVMGQGNGKLLLEEILREANRRKLDRVTLNSTLNAVGFYRHHGFSESADEHTVTINGEQIRCVPMEKNQVRS